METATHLGADAPTPFALEMTAPANTPAYLSTHDAAAVLRKLRQPKGEQTTTDPGRATTTAVPDQTTESPAGDDPADDAAHVDAQDPGAKTEGTDPGAAELSPIEPPRSWTKEDKELFTGLPRATQERLAER
jgi:hypothetical protein